MSVWPGLGLALLWPCVYSVTEKPGGFGGHAARLKAEAMEHGPRKTAKAGESNRLLPTLQLSRVSHLASLSVHAVAKNKGVDKNTSGNLDRRYQDHIVTSMQFTLWKLTRLQKSSTSFPSHSARYHCSLWALVSAGPHMASTQLSWQLLLFSRG